AARIWLEKEPPRSIFTWDALVSKFINHEAWDRFKDLLRACPHHRFLELHQLDTFYNALNSKDQDSLNSAARGNFLDRMPRECLGIIESKSKVRYSRNKPVVAKVSATASTSGVSHDVDELKDMVRALLLKKKGQSPALVKVVEESCVTCGGAHSYRNCPATDGNNYRDNIQEFVSQASAVNFNQRNTGYRPPMMSNHIRPPSFPPVTPSRWCSELFLTRLKTCLAYDLFALMKHGLVSKTYYKKSLIMALTFGSKSKSSITMSIPSQNKPLTNRSVVKAITLPQDASSTSDRRLIELENQVHRLMEAHLAPTLPTQVNKITTSCEICSGPHDTRNCMEDLKQAFVKYVSSRIDEVGGVQIPYYAKRDFLDCHFLGEWEIARDAEINPFKDVLVFKRMVEFLGALPINLKSNIWESKDLIKNLINWNKPPKNKDRAWHAKIRLIDPEGEEFTKTLQSIPTTRKLSKREGPREIIKLNHFYDT
nr:reverse transcriptase domain-containing protein [Tanacetum cinerariifolium]